MSFQAITEVLTDRDRLSGLLEPIKKIVDDNFTIFGVDMGSDIPTVHGSYPISGISMMVGVFAFFASLLCVCLHFENKKSKAPAMASLLAMMISLFVLAASIATTFTFLPRPTAEEVAADKSSQVEATLPAFNVISSAVSGQDDIMDAALVHTSSKGYEDVTLMTNGDRAAALDTLVSDTNVSFANWTQKLIEGKRPLMKITYTSGQQVLFEATFNADGKLALVEPVARR